MGKAEEIIRERILEEYGSIRKFAEKIDVPNTTLHTTLERGIRATNSVDVALKVFKELNLDTDAFIGGMVREKSSISDANYIEVAFYGSIAAGVPVDMQEIQDWLPVPREIAEKHPDGFLLKVSGTSMDRVLPDGCHAFIAPTKEVISGKRYALTINGYDATLKRVEVLANGLRLVPESYDPTFKPMVYDFADPECENVAILGRVVWATFPFDYIDKA